MLVEGAEARYIVGQAQPAGLGATFEALAGAKEPTQAVRIQLGEALRACGGHLLRPKVHERGAHGVERLVSQR